jgi:hypothetical protein
MTDKKKIMQSPGFFKSTIGQNLILTLVIILLATAIAARKQFILDPYVNFMDMPQVYISTHSENMFGEIHPLYSQENYVPPGQKIVPASLLFSAWFHIISAIVYWAMVIGGVFALIRLVGLSKYQSMVMTLFTMFIGNLITRELFGIPLLAPAPFVGYQYYTFWFPIIPISIIGLFLMLKKRFLISGIMIGLATFFHIKFGFRFFGLLFFSLFLWKFWGSQRLGLSKNDISWRNIFTFAMGWGILFITTLWDIQSSIHFFDSLDLPQGQPLTSQLAWLIKNEPDDWLISYHFPLGRPLFGFFFMAIAIGTFCEIILKLTSVSALKKFAVVWEIATLGAVLFFGFGFLFESFLIDLLPLSLAHSITLTRFWDLIWVVVMGFWIILFLAITVMVQKMFKKFGKHESLARNLIFHPALILFVIINVAIFVKGKQGEFIAVSKLRTGKMPVLKIMDYVQICDDVTPDYNKFYWMAVRAIQAKDDKGFQEALSKLNEIYDDFKGNLENPPLQNLDSIHLTLLNHQLNNRYAMSIKESHKLNKARRKDAYWWSCLHSDPGVHRRSFEVPTKDYLGAAEWIKANIPLDTGIIQPPYLGKFHMFSDHVGFWDGKIDQHMMYIIKGYYGMGLHRLRSVAGPYAWEIEPGAKNRGLGPEGRWFFLDLTKNQIIDIHRNYPKYNYLLTGNKNLQGYPAVYSNPSLALYDISKP